MDKKSKKAYDKAMMYYEKGKINKALDVCESALSENLKNSAVLNFKGLLLYQKGELNEAITVWKINKDFNNDSMAKNYINDAKADEFRLQLYKEGEKQLKQFNIDKAIDIFKKCSESDFNAIKVSTALGLCYQKKGNFKLAKVYVDKALSIDENAITAKTLKKELLEAGVYEIEKKSHKNLLIPVCLLLIILIIISSGYIGWKKVKENSIASNNIEKPVSDEASKGQSDAENANLNDEVKENLEEDSNKEKADEEESSLQENKKYFDLDKLQQLIQNNDFEGIYDEITGIKEEDVKPEDKWIYRQSIDLLKGQGIQNFYNNGLAFFNQKNYENAIVELNKAHDYCEESYLKEHILFYLGSSESQKGDNSNAIKTYEEYYNEYPKGVYAQGVIYELALLNSSVDIEKSKFYANTLINEFPGSIYINDYIVNILNS